MPEIEIDFPRGGTLADDRPARPPVKRRAKAPQAEHIEKKKRLDDEYNEVFTKVVTRDLLTTDVRGLAFVKKIEETEVILETAHGIQLKLGALHVSHAFGQNLGQTALDEIFTVGQALAFRVIKPAKSRDENPVVTIDPSALNAHLVPAAYKNGLVINGAVVSIEDKGAVIDVGTGSKMKGFVKREDLPPAWALERLRVGQVLMFRVRKTSAGAQRVLDLSAYAEVDVYHDEQLVLGDLMPGTVISVEPDKSVRSGVFVKADNEKKVFIHKSALPPRLRLHPERFARAIRVVVVCTLPNSPLFVVSAHPDVVAVSKPEKRALPEEYRPGKTVECTVYDIDKIGNVYFVLGTDDEKPPMITAKALRAYVDDYENEITKFELGSTHKCRVVGYHALDRSILISTQQKTKQEKPLDPKQRKREERKQQRDQEAAEAKKAEQKEVDEELVMPVKRPAKPFQVLRARVVGQWIYGHTSKWTTAELRLDGGTIGRLHVSEIDHSDCADGESPMTEFMHRHRNKFVDVKVICVGSRNSVTDNGQRLILKRCGTTRFVECTMLPAKMAEPHKKLRLINYKSAFEREDRVNVFVGDAAKMDGGNEKYVNAEVNPLFSAHIPKVYVPKVEPNDDADLKLPADDFALRFNNGEKRSGLVISQARTARAKYLTVALGDCIVKEEPEDVDEVHEKAGGRKRRASDAQTDEDDAEEEDVKPDESVLADPGFDFTCGPFSMERLSKVGKTEGEEAEEDVSVKEESDEEMDEEDLLVRERKIAEREKRLAAAIPESPLDFDRLLTAAPNSSDLWIKYITHYLREENLAEARRIAERALESVNCRKETERFNVWTAYLNAEIMFGDADSWRPIFQRAANAMDSLRMHQQMLKILAHHQRADELDELHEAMVKKFRHQEPEVWFAYAEHLYATDRADKARELLQRALNSSEKKQHLLITSRFAKLECRLGDEERGKTMIERMLQTYPRKALQRLRLGLPHLNKGQRNKSKKSVEVEDDEIEEIDEE